MIGTTWCATRGMGDTPYNGLYGKVPPTRDSFFESSGIGKGRDFTS